VTGKTREPEKKEGVDGAAETREGKKYPFRHSKTGGECSERVWTKELLV